MQQSPPKSAMRNCLSIGAALVLVPLLFLLPAQVKAEEDPLVGIWYGHDRQPDGHLVQRISRRSAGGAFSVEFREYENCVLVWRSIEKGTWQRKGNIEIVAIEKVGVTPRSRVDHYEIVEIGDLNARSRHVESGTIFSYQRVSADFEFPTCELFS